MVAFQVTLLHRGKHSFLLKSPVQSETPNTMTVQLTATTVGFSTLVAQTTLLHGGWDNDRKVVHNYFLDSDNTITMILGPIKILKHSVQQVIYRMTLIPLIFKAHLLRLF